MVVWSASQLAATEAVPACATAGAMQIAKTSMPIEFFMLLSQLSFEKVAANKAYGEPSSTPFVAVEPGISWIILESIAAHTGMSNFGDRAAALGYIQTGHRNSVTSADDYDGPAA